MKAQEKRDHARRFFSESGLSYSNITSDKIDRLKAILTEELIPFSKKTIQMRLRKSLKKNSIFHKDGSLSHFQIQVDGSYFTHRECITFNKDGFIGFAGWADAYNVEPFVSAFIKWVTELKKEAHL